jgi:hypothetical protein
MKETVDRGLCTVHKCRFEKKKKNLNKDIKKLF